jgi:hypothetical protein
MNRYGELIEMLSKIEYAKLYLEGDIQIWVDAEDSLELW